MKASPFMSRTMRFPWRSKFPILALTLMASIPMLTEKARTQELGGFYVPSITMLPLTGDSGEGTISAYGPGQVAQEKAPDTGKDILRIPKQGRKDIDVYWTFWGHRRPAQDGWPMGPTSRCGLVIETEAAATLSINLKVKTGDWSEVMHLANVQIVPGKPNAVQIPLPTTLKPGAIENVHLVLSSTQELPGMTLRELSVGEMVNLSMSFPDSETSRLLNPVELTGRSAGNSEVTVEAIGDGGRKAAEWKVKPDEKGMFRVELDRKALPEGPLQFRAVADLGGQPQKAEGKFYIFPLLIEGEKLASVSRQGADLMLDGKPWAFLGLNYARFLIEFSRGGDYQAIAEDLRNFKNWGLKVIRVPMPLGMIQPEPGIFPDNPKYAGIIKAHGLDVRFFDLFEYCLAVAAHHGIRVVWDWHEMPTDPYRYFVGGNETERKAGQPGKGIAWLYDQEKKKEVLPGEPIYTKALTDTNRWLAKRFKGNGTFLGFEAPYNEPHGETDSTELAWRKITTDATLPILEEDPGRLVFGMPSAWGHNNVLVSTTWLPPDLLTGMAPHDYIDNGPVPARPDAKQRPEPWRARDVDQTLGFAFTAMALPYSAVQYPVWNGESGEYGYSSFLPDLPRLEASEVMMEAQIVQAYASGWVGCLDWTLAGNAEAYTPLMGTYEKVYKRFSSVYAEGPVSRFPADVLFIQNVSASPVDNGLNYACIPFAKLSLDLHLAPIHYMTDDQFLANGLVQMSMGLEQVEQVATGLHYKAIVVDTRNLDSRVKDLIKKSKLPVLEVSNAAELTSEKLVAFLKNAGVQVDVKTPAELQLVVGPGHLLVYRRGGDGPAKVFPHFSFKGRIQLIDEEGKTVFSGATEALAKDGISVDLPKWRTAIFKIRKSD